MANDMRGVERIMTDDEADWHFLKLANAKGKFAIQLAPMGSEAQAQAFDRGVDNDWWTLIDVAPIPQIPNMLMRVFKLTLAGAARRDALALVHGGPGPSKTDLPTPNHGV